VREIKFRAYGPTGMTFFDNEQAAHDQYIAHHLMLMMANKHPQGKDLLMQYTGLKDKNGVEIYEGDIIKSSHSDDKWRGEIIWRTHHGTGFWVSDDRMIIKSSYCNPLSSNNSVTNDAHMWLVVGNIHENPELLENET